MLESCTYDIGPHSPLMRVQSVLARGLHALLPPIEVIKGSYCNANPENRREWEVQYIVVQLLNSMPSLFTSEPYMHSDCAALSHTAP